MARRTGPDKLTRDVVLHRDRAQCAFCGKRPGGAWSIHHRTRRGMGGTRADYINWPSNLVILCGTGTTECHGWVESNRTKAKDLGLLVHWNHIPSQRPIQHAVHGLCWLTDDGEAVFEQPVMSA